MATKPIPVPTLSLAGWQTSPAEKIDSLLSHWYCSDKAQTFLFGDQVANIQWLIEQHGSDPYKCLQAMREELQQYLGRYYDAVNVSITAEGAPSFADPKVELKLFAEVTEGLQTYSVGKLLQISNSKFSRIVALNNTGEEPNASNFN